MFCQRLFLVSDDGFKMNGASGFSVGMIQDYVMTDVYWLLIYIYLIFARGKLQGMSFMSFSKFKFVTGFHVQCKQSFNFG